MGGGRVNRNILGHGSFEKIISLENLFLAWREFKRGKRNKPDVQSFEYNLEDNLFKLHNELKSKTYEHSEYIPFYVTDPKVRHIHKASVRDRVLHHAIFRILYPVFDISFIHDSYSCRNKKGIHRAVKRLEQFAVKVSENNKKNIWSLKCDISKFFDSIDHGLLLELLENKIQDKDVVCLLKVILYSFEKQKGKAIPLGNVTSQLFANVYLNELDQFAKHQLKELYYLRYCDDFIFLAKDKESLETLVPRIQVFLDKKLKLILHPRKIIFRKYSQGIDFLGYVIRPYHTVIRIKTKKRMFRKLKVKMGNQEFLSKSIPSYLGMLKHAKSRKIKKQLQNLLISANVHV